MTFVILSFTSNQVQAIPISGAPTEVHQNLVHCITVNDRNFRIEGTLMISVNERTGLEGHKLGHFLMCKINCYDVKNYVLKELNNLGRWSVTLHDHPEKYPTVSMLRNMEFTLHLSVFIQRMKFPILIFV
jgi:hypothetical protein